MKEKKSTRATWIFSHIRTTITDDVEQISVDWIPRTNPQRCVVSVRDQWSFRWLPSIKEIFAHFCASLNLCCTGVGGQDFCNRV